MVESSLEGARDGKEGGKEREREKRARPGKRQRTGIEVQEEKEVGASAGCRSERGPENQGAGRSEQTDVTQVDLDDDVYEPGKWRRDERASTDSRA